MGKISYLEKRREEIVNIPAGDEIGMFGEIVFFVEFSELFYGLVGGHHNLEFFKVGRPFHHVVHLMDAMVAAGTEKNENDGNVLFKALTPEFAVAHRLKLEGRDVGMLLERWNLLLRKCRTQVKNTHQDQ
jgi:hypothetical protein